VDEKAKESQKIVLLYLFHDGLCNITQQLKTNWLNSRPMTQGKLQEPIAAYQTGCKQFFTAKLLKKQAKHYKNILRI